MATTIVTKNGTGAPTDSDLVAGELAVDLTNGRLYTTDLDSGGTVIEIGLNPSGNVDVTGTVTADGLTVDGLTQLNTNNLANGLTISGNDNANVKVRFDNTGASGGDFVIQGGIAGASNEGLSIRDLDNSAQRIYISSGGDISFYEDTGTTAKFFWDASAESLGIGTTSPSDFAANANNLVVGSGAGTEGITINSGTANYGVIYFADGTSGSAAYAGNINYNHADNSMRLGTNGSTTDVVIDSSGNVGIGTSSPASLVTGGSSPVLSIGGTDGGLTTGEKAGALSFITSDGSYTGTYADGITGEIVSVTESATGAAYGLAFYTGTITGSNRGERLRIDNNGNVGIGIDSPSGNYTKTLHIHGSGSGASLHLTDPTSGATASDGLEVFQYANDGYIWERSAGDLRFGTSATERMRIDASGNLLVGDNSVASASNSACTINSGGRIDTSRAATNLQTHHQFFNPNGVVGTITTTGSATAFNTSSDQRLKENIVDAPSASDDIDAIQVRSFDWKADGSHQKYGMVAQELQSVAPEAVSAPEDPEEMMGVDYSKLVPMMLKEIQSLRARVAQLES